MNSISYLDSVLSRSFASDKNLAPPKRSQSYSSIPGSSRRPATSSGASLTRADTPHRSGESRHRDSDDPYAHSHSTAFPRSAKLRRTGSTPAGVSNADRLYRDQPHDGDCEYSDQDDADAGELPRARWSALWGLTGWIDDAINPSSTTTPSRSRKTSSTKQTSLQSRREDGQAPPPAGQRQSRRVRSLDSLLMASSAPMRHTPRRTASSGMTRQESSQAEEQIGPDASHDTSSQPRRKVSLRRRNRFGHAASLTMTGAASPDDALTQPDAPEVDEREMMSEREREDIVDFDGGDFAPDDVSLPADAPAEAQRSAASQHSRQESGDSQSGTSSTSSAEDCVPSDGQGSFDHAASQTSKASPFGAELSDLSSEPRQDTHLLPSALPDNSGETLSALASSSHNADEAPTPSISRRGSRRASLNPQGRARASMGGKDPFDVASTAPSSSSSSSSSSVVTSTTATPDTKGGTHPQFGVRRRSRKGRGSSDLPSRQNDAGPLANGWLSERAPPSDSAGAPFPSSSTSAAVPGRRHRFYPTRAFRRALIALRDVLVAILTAPLKGMQLMTGGRRRRKGMMDVRERKTGHPGTREVPVLLREKSDDAASIASSDGSDELLLQKEKDDTLDEKGQPKSLSGLRFAQTDVPLKRPRSNSGRPRTPRPELAPAEAFPAEAQVAEGQDSDPESAAAADASKADNDSDDAEPVTEEQAAARAEKQRQARLAAGNGGVDGALQRPPLVTKRSRLLPNPHPIDPMLAHDRKAQPVDEAMACEEARLQAERKAKVDERRAARRAAQLDPSSTKAALELAASTAAGSHAMAKVPRGPSSSVIHHTPKILVLDLDETLIHSTSRSPTYFNGAGRRVSTGGGILGLEGLGAILGLRANENPGRIRPHMVEVILDGRSVIYHVYKRPWVDYFLRKVASWYHVVIFTASVQEYADPVIDWLDQGRGLIGGRLFREACTYKNGSYVKNLQVVNPDLSTVCLVDNSPASYAHNQANGIPIEGWTHDPNDEALLDLLPVLDSLRFTTDVRHILGIRGFSA